MGSSYTYNRIDLAKDAIRLVRLLEGDQNQPIKCEMFETYLHQVEGTPYEALSYVWGTRMSAERIMLDGCLFEVTKNLFDALMHLRRPGEDRVLWIDAICIDQSHEVVSDCALRFDASGFFTFLSPTVMLLRSNTGVLYQSCTGTTCPRTCIQG